MEEDGNFVTWMSMRSGSWYALLSLPLHEPVIPLFRLHDQHFIWNSGCAAETIHSFFPRRLISSIQSFAMPVRPPILMLCLLELQLALLQAGP